MTRCGWQVRFGRSRALHLALVRGSLMARKGALELGAAAHALDEGARVDALAAARAAARLVRRRALAARRRALVRRLARVRRRAPAAPGRELGARADVGRGGAHGGRGDVEVRREGQPRLRQSRLSLTARPPAGIGRVWEAWVAAAGCPISQTGPGGASAWGSLPFLSSARERGSQLDQPESRTDVSDVSSS